MKQFLLRNLPSPACGRGAGGEGAGARHSQGPLLRCATAASLALLLSACATNSGKTIGSLQKVDIEIKEQHIDGSLEKALASYQKYLQETPETALTPEAMRRIAANGSGVGSEIALNAAATSAPIKN